MLWRIPLEDRQNLEQLKDSLDKLFNIEEQRLLAG